MALKKCFLATAFAAAAVGASAAQPSAALIEVRPDGTRTLLTTERLSRNDRIIAQQAETTSVAKCCVALRILETQKRRADVSDELSGRRVRAYALPPLTGADTVPYVGGALVIKAREKFPTAVENALLSDPAGKLLPDVCTSSEGAHLLQLRDGKPRAHLYMQFGYSVEPTCSDELLKKFY